LTYSVVSPPEDGSKVDVIHSLDLTAIFISLGVVLGGIFSGLYLGYKYDNAKFHARANKFGSFCGLGLIVFSGFLGSGAGGSDTHALSLPWSFYVGVAFPCIVGMALANIIARSFRLSRPETVAISIECCYQNTAIATSVAVTMFTDPTSRTEAVSVPLFYGLVEAVIIGIYCVWAWRIGWTKAPANEKICVVLTKTYEVDQEEEMEQDFDAEASVNWFSQLFIPREFSTRQIEDTSEKKTTDRSRFYSADITVATSLGSPPGTPENSAGTANRERAFTKDLEAPSIQEEQEEEAIEAVGKNPVEQGSSDAQEEDDEASNISIEEQV